ncbi:MAG: hypothetical protein F6J96_10975 [Symploca sp. SIO1C2]|nr:hypothetical protein [Symploca sp. SIO1C2]
MKYGELRSGGDEGAKGAGGAEGAGEAGGAEELGEAREVFSIPNSQFPNSKQQTTNDK